MQVKEFDHVKQKNDIEPAALGQIMIIHSFSYEQRTKISPEQGQQVNSERGIPLFEQPLVLGGEQHVPTKSVFLLAASSTDCFYPQVSHRWAPAGWYSWASY